MGGGGACMGCHVSPPQQKILYETLEGASDVHYEARDDIPGVRFIRQDEDEESGSQL